MRTYYVISGLYTLSASLIWGVNTLFLLAAGLDIFGVFVANAVFTGAMALFEIPTGVVADTWGRRASFLLSAAVLIVGTLGYVAGAALSAGLLYFCLASVVLGLGFTFYSGAVEAWLVDALRAAGHTGQVDSVFARGALVSSGAMLIGTVGGGALATWDLKLPFILRAALLGVVLLVAFRGMRDIGFSPRPRVRGQALAELKRVAADSMLHGWREPGARLIMILTFIRSVVATWGFYAWQPYFLALLGHEAPWVTGVIAALVSLAMMVGNGIVERATRVCGRRSTLLGWSVGLQAALFLGVGLSHNFWIAVGCYLLAMIGSGVIEPVKQAYLHQVIPSAHRATILSFSSLCGSGGSMIGQSGLGYLSRAVSIAAGYVVGGAVLTLALPVVMAIRRLDQAADRIVGTDTAGAQGLVDCDPRGASNT
jgi:MFS family permease